ncbi:MAG: DUF2924 domain-containing protein [Candidatus Saccharibacteria bacterium]|nr:DUF2924 domain-containing protein [Pseudorhodobacter sp.]
MIGVTGQRTLGDGDLATTLAALETQDGATLRATWQRLYRTSPPDRISRDLLIRAISYRLQELAHGGLRPAAKRKLAAWSNSLTAQDAHADGDSDTDADEVQRNRAPAAAVRLKPGATLIRTWHGVTHTVQVGEEGFEHQGVRYASLSHIAQIITGTHWSGPRFFGLTAKPRSMAEVTMEKQHVRAR